MGQADKEQARKQFEKAELALKKQNYEYAVALLQQGLILNPTANEYRTKKHHVCTLVIQEKGGNPEGGLGTKFKVIKYEANLKKLQMQKKFEEALIEHEKILALQPQNIPSLFALGQCQQNLEHWTGATTTYEEILVLDRTQVEAHRALGKIYGNQLDDLAKAIDHWENVRQYKPEDKEAGKAVRDLSAASMVRKADDKKKAGGDSFRSMLKDEDEAADLEAQSQLIRTDADRVRAIKMKMAQFKKDPRGEIRLMRDIAGLYIDLKLYDKAEVAYKTILKVNPEDLYAKERLGQLKEIVLEEEIVKLREKANGASDPAVVAELEEKEQEFLKYRVTSTAARVKAHPTDFSLKFAYGGLLMRTGSYDEAVAQFQQAVKDPKQRVGAKKGIGECFLHKELFDLAKGQFGAALADIADKSSDMWKEVKYSLANACEKGKETQEALKHYQEIMSIDISYRDVSKRVTKLMSDGGGD